MSASPAPPMLADMAEQPERFLDRDASWLEFNRRVLALAQDPEVPLLERARFLAIFANNLDEFFMLRVAGLKRRMATGLATRAASGLLPREVLQRVTAVSHELMAQHATTFHDEVLPALSEQGIDIVRWADLSAEERAGLDSFFTERLHPVLTPLAVDPAHPFPYISGLSLNLAVVVRDPVSETEMFARVKVPPLLPRLVPVGETRLVPLEDVIAEHLPQLFQGMDVVAHHAFRVTRNADVEVDADDVENLIQALERELDRRRFGPPVRLEVEESIDEHVLELLVRELGISTDEVFRVPGPLDLTALHAIADIDRAELRYPAFVPVTHPRLQEQPDVFAALRSGDILVHHPYDSFATSVQAFIEQAAADPDVLAIKQTLYRTSGDSPVVDALIDAAQSGKQVLVLVEIKARFDEIANIRWARALEQAGCHVVYGLVGLKTHCKTALVVRREGEIVRRYSHVGTGNYNPKTARLYEDIGLLTADEAVGADLTDLFNQLSGYSRHDGYRSLLVAPRALREGIVGLIDEQAALGAAGRVVIKANSLVDEEVIDALYAASSAGAEVNLLIRGICALRPQCPGLSERIRVRSILGRFLEHSRVFVFGDAVWIGSADLMHRNLDRRVEVVARVRDELAVARLREALDLLCREDILRWELGSDGTWIRCGEVDAQQLLIGKSR
ncbi:MAG: polyphosphate kinase [Frankiaceae bacterium]|nr:polyphosphate kinase [Frankiaceae bacterium]MDX6225272.1 polyphosphate kinase [Frankiales bacterium]